MGFVFGMATSTPRNDGWKPTWGAGGPPSGLAGTSREGSSSSTGRLEDLAIYGFPDG